MGAIPSGYSVFGVQAPARPATSLGPFASLLSTAFAPIVLRLILPNFRDIFFVPTANPESIQRLHWWGLDLAFNNPTVERAPTYSEHLCDFDCRVSLHRYNEIGLFHLSS
jgi:hypothetical protein